MAKAEPRDFALILLIGLFWGLNWPAVKVILSEIPPWTLRAVGLGVAAPILIALAAARGETLRPFPGETGRLVLAGLLSVFGFNILTGFGQLLTETSQAAIIAFTMPVWAALMAALFLGERLTGRHLAALALGTGALAALAAEDWAGILAAPAGLLVMLGAALSWAAGTVALKGLSSQAPLARAGWMVAVSAVPAALGAAVFEGAGRAEWPSLPVLGVLAFHIALPMVACYAAWTVLVSRLPVAVATLGTLLIPVVGVVSAALLLGERIGPLRLLALGLVLSAIAVGLRGARPLDRRGADLT